MSLVKVKLFSLYSRSKGPAISLLLLMILQDIAHLLSIKSRPDEIEMLVAAIIHCSLLQYV
jgi:hypothetical protein